MSDTLFITDTHAHIYEPDYDQDFDQMIARCREAGVERFILPGVSSADYDRVIACADALPGVAFPCIGLHPTEVKPETWEAELEFVRQRLDVRKWTAIGEIGMDCHWSVDALQQQKAAFRTQLIWAAERNLPVLLHVREAIEYVWEVFDSIIADGLRLPRGVFHAYSGSFETWERIKRYGDFYLGIGGVVTYKNAGVASVVERVPLDRILLETDCPWLSPVPHRGERNEPSRIPLIVDKIASLRGISASEVVRACAENTSKLFGI